MLTTNFEVQFYDRWCKLQMRACYRSWKTPFSCEEETRTLPNAEPDTEHEPRGRKFELKYVNTNCKEITYHLQSNWNTYIENWCKAKHKESTNASSDLSPEGLAPVKSRHFIPMYSWQLSKSYNCENNNFLLLLEPQQITPSVCHVSIFSSLLISWQYKNYNELTSRIRIILKKIS